MCMTQLKEVKALHMGKIKMVSFCTKTMQVGLVKIYSKRMTNIQRPNYNTVHFYNPTSFSALCFGDALNCNPDQGAYLSVLCCYTLIMIATLIRK